MAFRWLSDGFRWLSDGFRRLPMAFRWLPTAFRWLSDGFRWLFDGFRRLFDGFRRLPMAFRWLQTASDGFSMASGRFRWLLIASDGVCSLPIASLPTASRSSVTTPASLAFGISARPTRRRLPRTCKRRARRPYEGHWLRLAILNDLFLLHSTAIWSRPELPLMTLDCPRLQVEETTPDRFATAGGGKVRRHQSSNAAPLRKRSIALDGI